jgi:hypothetical protein
MTGPGAKKHLPRREWIDDICAAADEAGIPVFMKDSLLPIIADETRAHELRRQLRATEISKMEGAT